MSTMTAAILVLVITLGILGFLAWAWQGPARQR